MNNINNLIEMISEAGDEKRRAELRMETYKQRKLEEMIEDISMLRERIGNLVKVANCLLDFGFNLGEKTGTIASGDLMADGFDHNLGFILYRKVTGIGIKGGGCCGGDLIIDTNGNIEKGLGETYDKSEVQKMKRFLSEFDSFEKKVSQYVYKIHDKAKQKKIS